MLNPLVPIFQQFRHAIVNHASLSAVDVLEVAAPPALSAIVAAVLSLWLRPSWRGQHRRGPVAGPHLGSRAASHAPHVDGPIKALGIIALAVRLGRRNAAIGNCEGSMRRLIFHAVLAAAAVAAVLSPAAATAAITAIGSPLSGPATYNTTENLNYRGTDTSLPAGARTPPRGSIHTYHSGADTGIWNTALASGMPAAPTAGQALQVKLEGCAEPAPAARRR